MVLGVDRGKASDPVAVVSADVALSDSTAIVGQEFSSQASLTNINPSNANGYTTAYSFGGPAQGLTCTTAGVISGVASAATTVPVRCNITNPTGTTVAATYATLTISAASLEGEMTEAETPPVTKKGKK